MNKHCPSFLHPDLAPVFSLRASGIGHPSSAVTGGPESHRIRLVPFDEIRLSSEPPWLVSGLVPRVGLTVVWGPPKSGKSFWVFDLSLHVALGREYRGRRVRQGSVVYCAFEGQAGIGARAEAFRQRFLAESTACVPFYLQPVRIDLSGEHRELIEAISSEPKAEQPVLVVLDTLNRSMRGSESSDIDMSAYVKAADAIRSAFDCAVIIIHHSGIDVSRPRGHTSLTGAADAQISIKRTASQGLASTVEFMKDGPEGDTLASRLESVVVGVDQDESAITSCVVVEDKDAGAPPRTKVTGAAKIALGLLERAIIDAGEIPAESNHIPANTRTVAVAVWRSYCNDGSIADSDKPDSKQKAFVRCSRPGRGSAETIILPPLGKHPLAT